MKKFDIIIIGAGQSGCILAQRYASVRKKVLIIEKRSHIVGNSYDNIIEKSILPSADFTTMSQKAHQQPYIEIMLNTDYFDIRNEISGYEKLFFTEL